ncbi:MAG: gliding motility protein GldL [Bacteroidetes bacterium]|nr:gliding motility protein GldL [Bacteroidota bacterium]MCK6612268.1 gliding motility protein GldL [Bacteroidia bacterium]
MALQKKGKLDPITFLYGFGAAIILIGSMFKFIGWNYANELFIAGLCIEAIVFLVSAFEKTEDDKEYEWEKVFPQLDGEAIDDGNPARAYQQAMNQFSGSIHGLSEQIRALNASLENVRKEMQINAENGRKMHEKMEKLNTEFEEYHTHLEKINSKYRKFLNEGSM